MYLLKTLIPRKIVAISILIVLWSVAAAGQDAPSMSVEVDLQDLPRGLIHARMVIPVEPGPLALWYPKWIPGIHAPRGPIQNMAGLRIELPNGEPLTWQRDGEKLYRFQCEVPEGANSVIVYLDYICNQPSTNSTGVDCFGNSLVGSVNWNTCLLYPEGVNNERFKVRLSINLPEGWRFGTALQVEREEGEQVHFKTHTLREVIDSPLICGEAFRTIVLKEEKPRVYMHLTSEAPSAIQIEDDLIDKYRKLVAEAEALFGGAPYPEYHLLVVCSDSLPSMGLEHLGSSLNGCGERALVDEKKRKQWVAYLLPHEFVHAWCGKYRRPEGMYTTDYHTTKITRLLWVYEGMTQYLGEILAVRCGLITLDEYRDRFTQKVDWLMRQQGRQWRPLEDTAADSYHLRGGSRNWSSLRRGQDYYNEGLLMWLEIDAIIRETTDGQKSFDDFCETFLGPQRSKAPIVPFTLDEVYEKLNAVAPYDWEEFIQNWVSKPHESLPLEFVTRCGYRLQYSTKRSDYLKELEDEGEYVNAMDSLGITVGKDGEIGGSIVPGMIADKAGLGPGMKIQGVNDRKFTAQRLRDAVADSVVKGGIDLLILDGERFRTIKLDYADGPKYLQLVRDKDKPDILSEILKPLTE